ncbi:mechanosensitive ion channel family protein [Niveibacterium sp. 24ML]|uniref:mechanosensitive ion channel family protein n=1 Tax=Niveibacterium sp. 24ML TaxID=2985512 RepID=UPI00226F530D|nr:mechanosensitive ion channel domain-containing protein [Niveibacterium sp. 24ML]MCX9156125.1 mechanosensitive ion channel family protein [Niveibacterium sp. 24ML]
MKSGLRFFVSLFCYLCLALSSWGVANAADKNDEPPPQEATLTVANRDITVFRSSYGGPPPKVRAERAAARIEQLADEGRRLPVSTVAYSIGEIPGVAVMAGDKILFAISQKDIDSDSNRSLELEASEAAKRVEEVIAVYRDQSSLKTILRGIGLSILATLAFAGLIWLLHIVRVRITSRFTTLIERRLALTKGLGWARYTYGLVLRIVQLLLLAIALVLIDVWLTFVFKQFPITAPLGDHLLDFLFGYAGDFGDAALAAMPGIVAIAIIVFITQAIAGVVRSVFDATQAGTIAIPGIHPETASATRRIVMVGVWAFAFALCYPYIPGSSSDVFKGVSVLLGFLLTLGSAGVVSQLMGGLVLTYSRALRVGDYVLIGDVEGVVQELSTLSVKIVNVRNEEITIPNAVLLGAAIHNYSRRAESVGTLLTTKVTIGYDAPWRQIHALLIQAAKSVDEVRKTPEPYVYQRALNDFYVEYELFCHIDEARRRVPVLSLLHGAIQDAFNESGVQIMSPHFFAQPAQAVLSPKAQWYAAPAKPPQNASPETKQ